MSSDLVRMRKIPPGEELIPFGAIDDAGLAEDHPGAPQVIVQRFISGRPRPKGSMTPINRRGTATRLTEDNPHALPWLAHQVSELGPLCNFGRDLGFPVTLPVELRATYLFRRPAGNTDPYPTLPRHGGDTDKLLRNTLDALQKAGVIRNDSQVVVISAEKAWASEGEPEGVMITLREAL